MSGRKSWEVADLLQEGIKARQRTESTLNKAIENNKKLIQKADEEIADAQADAKNIPSLNSEAVTMFGSEGKNMVVKGQEASKKLSGLKQCGSRLQSLMQELASLDKELAACDREGDRIRGIISRKSGYLDNEYYQASELKKRYERLASRRSSIASEINRIAAEAQANASQAKALLGQVDKLSVAVEDMNKTAKNKADADALKKKLNEIIDDVDSKWANKFLSGKYKEMQMKIAALSGKSDELVIKEGTVVLANLNAFVAELTELTTAYQKAKADAENLREQAEALTGAGYVDPLDFSDNGEKAKQIALFTYLKKYKDTPFEAEFEKIMDDAESAEMEDTTEGFIRAQKLYEKAYAKAEEARDFALKLQENMIKGCEMSGAIDSVMYYDLKYNVETTAINGNPADGYRIVCSSGGEKITFDVKYDDDGNPQVVLDHEEDITGTCKNSMEGICRAVRGKGIPLTDIRKNNKTILGPAVVIPGTGEQDPGQQKRSH